jgi:hypothetical protein
VFRILTRMRGLRGRSGLTSVIATDKFTAANIGPHLAEDELLVHLIRQPSGLLGHDDEYAGRD